MNQKTTLIHTHFHRRKTGLTRSVETVFPFFEDTYDSYIYGYGIDGRKITTRKLLKILFSKKETIVHCHRNNELMRMLFFRFLGGKFKLIATRHAETTPSGLTKYLLKKADTIITLTKSMSSNLGLPNTIVGHGVNIADFIPKENVSLPNINQKNIISCVGRVRKAKGQKTLIKAISPILKNQKNWALIIVGKADKPAFLEELKSIVKNYNLKNQIYFLGETSEIISIYQASHTVVVPSFTEGFSLVCAEAMACGCNIIATKNVGVHSNLITNKQNGYLFEAGNTEELQQNLQQIILEKKTHLGAEARKEIIQYWSAEKESKNLTEVYQSV